jgi:hypothetical protein
LIKTYYLISFRSYDPRKARPAVFAFQSCIRSPDPNSTGLKRQPKKDLSRILKNWSCYKRYWTKINSKKYNNDLRPKAVLEALDEAIKEKQWESALKVCGFSFSWTFSSCQAFFFLLLFMWFWFEFCLFDGVNVYPVLLLLWTKFKLMILLHKCISLSRKWFTFPWSCHYQLVW